MSLMEDKVFKYILKFFLRFTENLRNDLPLLIWFRLKQIKTSYGGYDVEQHLNQ